MTKHAERRVLPYTAEQMFDLVAAVERYPEFLPWCRGARVRSREGNVIHADLVIGFKIFRERFTSRVELDRPGRIDVIYSEGPLRYLNNRWIFRPVGDGSCEVDFFGDSPGQQYLDGLPDQLDRIQLGEVLGNAGGAGVGQQLLDQAARALGAAIDLDQGFADFVGVGFPQCHLALRLQAGQWRLQLVRGIADKIAHRTQAAIEAIEHAIDGAHQGLEFVRHVMQDRTHVIRRTPPQGFPQPDQGPEADADAEPGGDGAGDIVKRRCTQMIGKCLEHFEGGGSLLRQRRHRCRARSMTAIADAVRLQLG